MDDSGVQGDLSRLVASISALDRRLADIDRRLGAVSEAVGSLTSAVVPAVAKVQASVSKLASELERDRVISAARDKRADLDRELQEKFGRHEEVRKLAAGIIHVVSTGVVDKEIILETAQRRMVDLPDYWLAPAIVGVAAWLSGDETKCAEAIDLATRLDRSKTALFMALLLRQHDRGDALQRWIDAYLVDLRPRNLPNDFQVVIDAVAGGALGDGSAPKLASWMTARYRAEIQSRDARAEAIGQWQQRLRSMPATAEFAPHLRTSSPGWAGLHERHAANLMIEAADRHLRDRFEAGADVSVDLIERMRELIKKLAATPDAEEDELRRDRRLEDAVARTGEREEAQQRIAAEYAGRTGWLNLLNLVAASAFPPSVDGKLPAPTVTELLAIVLSGELIASAADSLHDGTALPSAVEVRVGRFQERVCVFSCATDEEVSAEGLAAQAAAHHAEVMAQIRRETDERQYRLGKFLRRPLPVAVSSAAVIAAVPFVVPVGLPVVDFAAPAAVIAAGTGSWLGMLLQRLRQVQSVGAREKNSILSALQAAAGELADFFAKEKESAPLRTGLVQFLRALTPDDAYRVVRRVESPPFPQTRGFPDWTPPPPGRPAELRPPEPPRPLT